ncbi:MAG: septal ring lytic transglycosylase RlpA family protein [Rhodocyclaceae bacterium]|nr:septal ring lytic transglycosylase RlpA family protein [Rhodocyclaceae bacterium]
MRAPGHALRRGGAWLACVGLALALAGCTTPPGDSPATGRTDEGARSTAPLRPLARQGGVPADAPRSRVASVRYDLAVGTDGDLPPDDGVPGDGPPGEVIQRGGASWYGLQFHQRKTASGERFDMGAFTAAHKTLPFGTRLCVRSLVNGREVLVRVNDRGPYAAGRIIDLSQAAAEQLQMVGLGIKQVALTRIDAAGGRCNGVAVAPSDDAGGPALVADTPRPEARPRKTAQASRRRR